MLTADALAALEAATPSLIRARPPSDDASSVVSSSPSSTVSSSHPTASTVSLSRGVGEVRPVLAAGTTAAVDAADKWVLAALRALGKEVSDLVSDETHEPDDALCSEVHTKLADWYIAKVTARDAGVIDARQHELNKSPPQCILAKSRAWLIRHVNQERAKVKLPIVDDKWARNLANVKGDARAANTETRETKAADGSLYHHKHDLAPSYEQMTTMCSVAFTGDVRVSSDLLEAVEAGMAVAIYLPTGARGSELKKMHLQSIGYESIPHERSGLLFECLKLTAFECKTKDHHLNQYLPSSNPWRCGVGAFGVSVLVRIKRDGPPPFSMERNGASWNVIGSGVGRSFDRRLNDVFVVAGVRRQTGDPLTYLGRHFGTRFLQHQGGSAEGGAARRGHTSGATFAYSECPLPDLHRLMGNDPDRPFLPAHHQTTLYPFADAVIDILSPQLPERRRWLDARHREVDAIRSAEKAKQLRTAERLCDQERVLNGIRHCCRMALLCLVARPRMWKQWTIAVESPTMWQGGQSNRVVEYLFAGNAPAIDAMNELAIQVRRCEESEIAARNASPENAASNAVVTAVQQMSERAVAREEEMLRQQRVMFEQLMRQVGGDDVSSAPPLPTVSPRPEQVATNLMTSVSPVISEPLPGAREKRKSHTQDDVIGFASHPTLTAALAYAREELVPLERSEGHKWRRRKYENGGKDNSRHNHWLKYRNLAIAVGLRDGTEEEVLTTLETRRATYASAKAFAVALECAQKGMTFEAQEDIAKRVLGY